VLAEIETLGLDFIEVRQLTPERESRITTTRRQPVIAVQPNLRSNQSLRRWATVPRAASMDVEIAG